jgi:Asp-tRNA(Asn)/Glu-tRNA(Gln) amidotransferase A subunit family amidase
VNLLTLTAAELQKLFTSGVLTSKLAVKLYLDQIAKHNQQGLQLNAVISTADHAEIFRRAQQLDDERALGKVRGPFHGVPIIIKVK